MQCLSSYHHEASPAPISDVEADGTSPGATFVETYVETESGGHQYHPPLCTMCNKNATGIGTVGFNIPLNTLQVILRMILQVDNPTNSVIAFVIVAVSGIQL